ncbi:MAG TPA: hypothetical protein VFD38_12940, partial [Myxococcaceae bacterium]|nr:hypothetical protein [Myxococcaceae bacterium]
SGVSFPALPQAWPLNESSLPAPSSRTEITGWATLLGRSFLALGGAFLIRALTDGRILPGGLGVALGIAFAATWILFAHRAAARGAALNAGFHAVVAALIAYPLVLESTTRLGVMSTSVAALTLIGFTGLLLMASWRDQLGWLAWVGVLSCLVTTVVLLRATPGRTEFIGVLLVLAAGTFFWLGERWPALRWAPAVILDLAVLRAVTTATPPVLVSSLALAGLSLAVVLRRTALVRRPVEPFEAIQTVVGLVIGVAGALEASRDAGSGTSAVAAGVLAVSLLTIAFAGWVVPRRGNRDLDFLFYAALSLALLSSGVALLTGGALRSVLWSVLAVAAVLLGRRRHSVSLWSLATLLALGGAFGSGLVTGAVSPGSVTVLGLILAAYLVTLPPLQPSPSPPSTWMVSRLPAAVLLFLGSAGVAVLFLYLARGLTDDLARLAAARTGVAVVIALALALVRRRLEQPELTWIAWLALGLGGVELLLVELPNGRASTLLFSFVVFGAGLILVPRLAPPGRDFLSAGRPR